MDHNLKVLGDFLVEDSEEEDLLELQEKYSAKATEVVSYVENKLLLETTMKQVQDLADKIDVEKENALYSKKQALEEKMKNGSFKYTDVLDFAAEVSAIAKKRKEVKDEEGNPVIDPETRTQKVENVLEKLRINIKAIQKMEEPRRTRMAKMFAFQLVSALNNRAKKRAKEGSGQTRTTLDKEGEVAQVRSVKGLNTSSAVRTEVRRVVRTEANTSKRQIEDLAERTMKDEKSARALCATIFESFWQGFEGTKKKEQFEKMYQEIMKKGRATVDANDTKSEFEFSNGERIDWNTLNTFVLLKEMDNYAKGLNSTTPNANRPLTLNEIRKVVAKFKQANFDALEMVDLALGGKEDKPQDKGGQTKTRSGQQ